jgi:hypothetical protein
MERERGLLVPPGDLRPAQLGTVLLGRVTLGHASATLIDLAWRGLLRIEAVQGPEGPDWRLTDLRRSADRGALLRFETALLDGVFSRQSPVRLVMLTETLIPALDKFRTELIRDAVRHGLLRRWHRGQRTAQGDELLAQIRVFRRELRVCATAGRTDEGAPLVPYMILFGLAAAAFRLPGPENALATRGPDDFAASWMTVCETFGRNTLASSASSSPGADFVHEWSAPPGHDHSAHHGHGGGSGGYGDGGYGGHGGFGGHAGGGHAGGGHGG